MTEELKKTLEDKEKEVHHAKEAAVLEYRDSDALIAKLGVSYNDGFDDALYQAKDLSLPGHKSYIVLTRSMATTNNVQGDEPPRSIALERQVQTLMATVEHLMKQNHDLKE